MLRLRVITALVMMMVLLPALFARAAWPFAALGLLLIGAGGWEWGRLNGARQAGSVAMGLGVVAAGLAAWQLGWAQDAPPSLWWSAGAIWVVGGALALRAGPAGWPRLARPLRWGLGLVALWLAWLALAQARHVGINFVFSVMCLVWAADIAAYAGGRSFGRRKLARSISPGKSWEGAISGAVAVVLLAFLWQAFDATVAVDSASLYSTLQRQLGTGGLIVAVLFLSAMSVVGDLVESLVKRAAGAKDSSRLLPGHGGVLDRFDALLPVFPLALALGTMGRLP